MAGIPSRLFINRLSECLNHMADSLDPSQIALMMDASPACTVLADLPDAILIRAPWKSFSTPIMAHYSCSAGRMLERAAKRSSMPSSSCATVPRISRSTCRSPSLWSVSGADILASLGAMCNRCLAALRMVGVCQRKYFKDSFRRNNRWLALSPLLSAGRRNCPVYAVQYCICIKRSCKKSL